LDAIRALALPDVAVYLDGGESGAFGWPDYEGFAATLLASVYAGALAAPQLRGVRVSFAPQLQG
jgi:cellulose 1,4-beta-cellobiosidase